MLYHILLHNVIRYNVLCYNVKNFSYYDICAGGMVFTNVVIITSILVSVS